MDYSRFDDDPDDVDMDASDSNVQFSGGDDSDYSDSDDDFPSNDGNNGGGR